MGLLDTTRTFLEDRFESPETRTLHVGVSGGPDSMVLLDVLRRLREDLDYRLYPLHVNYRFHEKSDDAYRVVRSYCNEHDLDLTAVSVRTPESHREAPEGLEARARELRFEFFEAGVSRFAADGVFLAHHRDDQVETVLLNLGRGCGPGALAGMTPELERSRMTIYRPFLSIEKESLLEYATEQNLNFVRDPTNKNENHARNRIRHTVIPEWESVQPAPAEAIANLARRVQRENDFWNRYLTGAVEDWTWSEEVQVSRSSFREQHPAVQYRYLRRQIARLAGSTSGWNERNLRDVRELFVDGRSGAKLTLPDEFYALNEYDRGSLFCSSLERSAVFRGPFDPPETVDWLGVGTVELKSDGTESDARFSATVSADHLDRLVLRTWVPGDDLAAGDGGTKLKEVFDDRTIPYRARRYWPLLEVDDEVMAVPGLETSAATDAGGVRVVFRPDHPGFHQLAGQFAG